MKHLLLPMLLAVMLPVTVSAQDDGSQPPAEQETEITPESGNSETATSKNDETETGSGDQDFQKSAEEATAKAKELAGEAADKAADIAVKIDQNEAAQEAAAGILQPIYIAAETLAFPAFYWLAFALMAAGTVNFAFQLVIGKLAVLARGSINLKEILSDSVGLVISVIGLVLTTQAATENSTFTQSAALVLSSTAAGAVLGLFLYRWGQALEVDAVTGQKKSRKK